VDTEEARLQNGVHVLTYAPVWKTVTEVDSKEVNDKLPYLQQVAIEQGGIKDLVLANTFPNIGWMQPQPTDYDRDASIVWNRHRTMAALHPSIGETAKHMREEAEKAAADQQLALEEKKSRADVQKTNAARREKIYGEQLSMCNSCSAARPNAPPETWKLCDYKGPSKTGKHSGCLWKVCNDKPACKSFLTKHCKKCHFRPEEEEGGAGLMG
jgi:hypothetical protein